MKKIISVTISLMIFCTCIFLNSGKMYTTKAETDEVATENTAATETGEVATENMAATETVETTTEAPRSVITWNYDDASQTATVRKYVGNVEEVTVPQTVENGGKTYTVTTIYKRAFENNLKLKKITLPETITSIGIYAFLNDSSLESINLPESVENLGGGSFENCKSLKEIILPSKIDKINNRMFYDCESLENVDFNAEITSIGNNAFDSCLKLDMESLPETLESFGTSAFSNCKSLKFNDGTLEFPNGITSVPESCFSGCDSIHKVKISKNVTEIGAKAFADSGICIDDFDNSTYSDLIIFGEHDTAAESYALSEDIDFYTESEYVKMLAEKKAAEEKEINPAPYRENIGDVNGDSKIDSKDATLILSDYSKALLGKKSLIDILIGDVDNSGKIDSKDATYILKYYSMSITGTIGYSFYDYVKYNIVK